MPSKPPFESQKVLCNEILSPFSGKLLSRSRSSCDAAVHCTVELDAA